MFTTESQPDLVATDRRQRIRIPRSQEHDYSSAMAGKRREFIREQTGANLSHIAQYSFDPAILPGNNPTVASPQDLPDVR